MYLFSLRVNYDDYFNFNVNVDGKRTVYCKRSIDTMQKHSVPLNAAISAIIDPVCGSGSVRIAAYVGVPKHMVYSVMRSVF